MTEVGDQSSFVMGCALFAPALQSDAAQEDDSKSLAAITPLLLEVRAAWLYGRSELWHTYRQGRRFVGDVLIPLKFASMRADPYNAPTLRAALGEPALKRHNNGLQT